MNLINKIFGEGRYYRRIRLLEEENRKRKKPRTFFVFRLEGEDLTKNALFSSFEVGIKLHLILRGYLNKVASLLPPCSIQQWLYKLVGIEIEENVFIAPEFVADILVRKWTRIRKDCSIGLAVKCFNHLFEDNGRVLLGYIDIGEHTSIGGYTTITPGVTIGKYVSIGADVVIGPGVIIGDYAKIKSTSVIGSFVRIGEGAEVELGSVVLENVPPHMRVSGNPAKITSENPRSRDKQLTSRALQ